MERSHSPHPHPHPHPLPLPLPLPLPHPLSARRRTTQGRLAAWALAFATVAHASPAIAQTPSTPTRPLPPPSPAPYVEATMPGLSPAASWEATVAAHEARVAELERQILIVEQLGSEHEHQPRLRRLELDFQAAKDALSDFKERTTERNGPGMMVAGFAVSGLGGVAVVGGIVLGGMRLSCTDTSSSSSCSIGYGETVALTLAGVAAIAVGLPLIMVGRKMVRTDRKSSEPVVAARIVVGPGTVAAPAGTGTLAVGLRGAF